MLNVEVTDVLLAASVAQVVGPETLTGLAFALATSPEFPPVLRHVSLKFAALTADVPLLIGPGVIVIVPPPPAPVVV
jgi:hypothetical protein